MIDCKNGTLLEAYKTDDFQLTIRTILPGMKAGGHRHPKTNESWVVVRGEAVVRAEEPNGEREKFLVSGDRPLMFSVPAGTGHEIENVGEEEVVLVFWSDRSWDPGDVEPWSWQE